MSERFRMPDGCTGVTMQYGREYRADSRGYITVDNPAHAAAIKKSWQARRGLLDDCATVKFTVAQELSDGCPACGFGTWPWQTTCPRCGAGVKEDS